MSELVHILTTMFTAPSQRLAWPFLLSALTVSVLYAVGSGRAAELKSWIGGWDRWTGRSARVDYGLVLVNAVVKATLLGAVVAAGMTLALRVELTLAAHLEAPTGLAPATVALAYALTQLVVGDLSVYLVHRAMHRWGWLWRIHAVHHSATSLTPITVLRVHPLELAINTARRALVSGTLVGVFAFLAGGRVAPLSLYGVNVFTFAFFALGANLRHSHVPLAYPAWLERWLISPRQHQIHHSVDVAHHDRNFGSRLAVWDALFGTLVCSRTVGRLRFGLAEDREVHRHVIDALLLRP